MAANEIFKTALVTGASSGIGAAVARELVKAGLDVVAVGRDGHALQQLHDECGAKPVVCDVTHREALIEAIQGYDIDVLVNNAGIISSAVPFPQLQPQDIDSMIDVNLRAAIHLTHHCIQSMIERKRGHVFFVGSSAGLAPHPTASVYGATKAAISMFAQALRCDLLGQPIRITEIAPGRVETKLYRSALGLEDAKKRLYDDYSVLQPEDLAVLIRTALEMPVHVDVSRLELFPTMQVVGGAQIAKNPA